jgi:hypothetical protein
VPEPPPPPRTTVDVTPAAGLGEKGLPPRAVAVDAERRPERRKPPPPMLIETFEGFPNVGTNRATEPTEASAAERVLPDSVDEGVASVEEAQWKLELARPARLVQIGWVVSGEVVVGNHRGAGLVVPEVRSFPEQAFLTLDYFRVYVRGKKVRIERLQEGDARLLVDGVEVATTDRHDGVGLEVVRRDANLDPDFDVRFTLVDEELPDPRAKLLRLDDSERLAAALFTVGCPLRSPRVLRLGALRVSATFDGTALRLTDYLETYRGGDGGFLPVFHREAGKPYRTFPEDGAPVSLRQGDRVIVGAGVYELRTG